jgi:hypothetical protein
VRPSRAVPLLAAVALFGGGFSDGSGTPKLIAVAQSCHVQRSDGSTQELRHGKYVLVVRDASRTRYFSLVGPGVRKRTTARYIGTVRWTVRLKSAAYRFTCGSGRAQRGVLVVG